MFVRIEPDLLSASERFALVGSWLDDFGHRCKGQTREIINRIIELINPIAYTASPTQEDWDWGRMATGGKRATGSAGSAIFIEPYFLSCAHLNNSLHERHAFVVLEMRLVSDGSAG
ncbi:MAG TPA: hypothetical protein VFV38_49680 [Ktedonobacteraceae bacterium]|nr:hypothetical protein [Ktedonobacteraceae bacterium]